MYTLIIVLLLFLASPSLCVAGWFQDQEAAIAAINGASAPAPTYVCIGYEGVTCTLSSTPPNAYVGSADASYARSWTATENGTLNRVALFFNTTWAVTTQKVVVYDSGRNIIATGAITQAAGWVWSSTLVAEAGHSLDFATNDVLYFGISIDSAGTYNIMRTDNTGNQWNLDPGYLQDPADAWTSYNHNMAAQLEYAQR